jgi:Overcoming lysogenization defect protein-like, TOPRIM domain
VQAATSTPKAPRAVILVEGTSDAVAVETLAERRERNLEADGVVIVPIGGAQAIGRFLGLYGPDVKLAGLCDAAEEPEFRLALERAGRGDGLTRDGLERLGFFTCDPDLEAELIRAVGADAVLEVAEAHGDAPSFRTLQKQPEWRERPIEDQLHRWMGSGGSRKIRYARLLVEALDLTAVPRPLDRVLAAV